MDVTDDRSVETLAAGVGDRNLDISIESLDGLDFQRPGKSRAPIAS